MVEPSNHPPGGSNDVTAVALSRVIADYGRRAAENPDRLRAMLNDAVAGQAAQHRAAIDALVIATEEGVPGRLAAASGHQLVIDELVEGLVGWGLAAETSAWAVSTWVAALGGSVSVSPTALPATSPPLAAATPPLRNDLPPAGFPTYRPPGHTSPPPATVGTVLPEGAASPATAAAGHRRRGIIAAVVAGSLVALAGTAYALAGGGSQDRLVTSGSSSPGLGQASASGGAGGASSGPAASPTTPPAPSVKPTVKPSVTPVPRPTPRSTPRPTPRSTPRPTPRSTPRTTPRATPTPVPNPVAADWSQTYMVGICSTQWCEAKWVLHDGGTWDTVVIVGVSPGYGKARASGKTLFYWPQQNGPFTDYVRFYVMNSATGQKSNVATFTVNITRNPNG